MRETSYTRSFNVSKLIQLIIIFIIEAVFLFMLIFNVDLRNNIFENKVLTTLCIFIWISMICFLIFLILDFYMLRTITLESHHLSQVAYFDDLTNIPNRHSLDLLFKDYTSAESIFEVGCCMITLSNLGQINQEHNRNTGDLLLKDFSSIFEEIGSSYGFIGRNDGNEFVLVMDPGLPEKYQKFSTALKKRIASYNYTHPSLPIEIDMAYTLNSEAHTQTLNQLFAVTSAKLYNK